MTSSRGPCRFAGGRESTETPGAWLQKRLDWWESLEPREDPAFISAQREAAANLERMLKRVPERGATIWVADACSEQLHLAWLLSIFQAQFGEDVKVSLARPALPSRWSSHDWPMAVGICNHGELQSAKISLANAELTDSAIDIWSSFVDEDPRRFASLVNAPSTPMPTLRHLLKRFPDTRDGLARWERSLLARISTHPGERLLRTVGDVLCEFDDGDFVSDDTLFRRLLDLAQQGLLTLVGDGQTMQTCHFRMTELGARLLDGTANRTRASGMDRWIGGTHLRPGEPIWWYDGSSMTLVQD